jgi:hypothetical protein
MMIKIKRLGIADPASIKVSHQRVGRHPAGESAARRHESDFNLTTFDWQAQGPGKEHHGHDAVSVRSFVPNKNIFLITT